MQNPTSRMLSLEYAAPSLWHLSCHFVFLSKSFLSHQFQLICIKTYRKANGFNCVMGSMKMKRCSINTQEEEAGGYNRRAFFPFTWPQPKRTKQQPRTALESEINQKYFNNQIHIYHSGMILSYFECCSDCFMAVARRFQFLRLSQIFWNIWLLNLNCKCKLKQYLFGIIISVNILGYIYVNLRDCFGLFSDYLKFFGIGRDSLQEFQLEFRELERRRWKKIFILRSWEVISHHFSYNSLNSALDRDSCCFSKVIISFLSIFFDNSFIFSRIFGILE